MTTPLLTVALLAFAGAPLTAQQFDDSGLPNTPATGATSTGIFNGTGCGNGFTNAAPFVGGNGFAGNMVDIAPSVDMTIECVDVNWTVAESIDVAVWYCDGTVVGNDIGQNGSTPWTLISTATVTAAGANLATNVPVSGSPTFLAGSTYGLYIQVVNYATTAGFLSYTNGGPNTYVGTHCSLTTYYGKGDGLTSGTFNPRMWNGVLYTQDTGPSGPTLEQIGTCPGPVKLSFTNCTPNSSVAVLYGIAGSFTKPSNPCGGLTLAISAPTLATMLGTDGSGAASLSFNAPAGACGMTVQGVDVATCTATNAIVLL